jgi:hypothetical protein
VWKLCANSFLTILILWSRIFRVMNSAEDYKLVYSNTDFIHKRWIETYMKSNIFKISTISWTRFVGDVSIIRPECVTRLGVTLHSEITSWTRLRLTLSKGPHRVRVSLRFTWGQKQIQFPKRCVAKYLELRTTDKEEEPSNSETLLSFIYRSNITKSLLFLWLSRKSNL